MYPLTSHDIWFSTDPRESEAAAWDAYAERYHARAEQLVLAHLTETVPTGDVDRTDRAELVAALTRLVHAQDTAMITAWARELSDEIPRFEDWRAAQQGRAA